MSTPPPSPTPFRSPSTAEIIAENDDLLSEILSYLPVKPLLRFKSVSKQWNSVISHRRFSLLHSHRHLYPPSSGLVFLHHHRPSIFPLYDFISYTSSPSQSLPPFFSLLKSSSFDILQSCNGLFLCSSSALNIFVCNPTTNEIASIQFPVQVIDTDDRPFLGINLCFDPAISPYYHLLRVLESKTEESSYSIDVYSSETHQWRTGVIDSFRVPFDVEFHHGVYWEGGIHWLSHTETTIFFDYQKECVESLILPKAIEGAYIERFRYFGESRGHLHLIEIRTNCVQEFDVLELDRRKKLEWLVKYRINLDVLGRGFESEMFLDHSDRFGRGFRFYAFSVLAVVRQRAGDDEDEDEDESELVLSVPGKVISYNLKSKVSRLLCNVVDESDKLFPCRGHKAVQFIDSLYCL